VSLTADHTFIVPDKFLGKLLLIIGGWWYYNISVDDNWFYVSELTEILITIFQAGGAVEILYS
jgi:hypothetical protein